MCAILRVFCFCLILYWCACAKWTNVTKKKIFSPFGKQTNFIPHYFRFLFSLLKIYFKKFLRYKILFNLIWPVCSYVLYIKRHWNSIGFSFNSTFLKRFAVFRRIVRALFFACPMRSTSEESIVRICNSIFAPKNTKYFLFTFIVPGRALFWT